MLAVHRDSHLSVPSPDRSYMHRSGLYYVRRRRNKMHYEFSIKGPRGGVLSKVGQMGVHCSDPRRNHLVYLGGEIVKSHFLDSLTLNVFPFHFFTFHYFILYFFCCCLLTN